eukprot:TRINITY_DN75916_c0_g1_i1.p1 TRINITY_DN75916_c0_g1~~TRINITY_DN75916_c0_g1_i1.p1  ORF type:complete len:1299 (-),score=273.72 TRINITY_DN75916_c0_g1_i1:56-3952(-)
MAAQNERKKDEIYFDALPLSAFAVNMAGDVTDLNSAAVALAGFKSKVEIKGKNILDSLVSSEDRAESLVRLNEALEGGGAEDKSVKVTIVTRSGRKQVVLRTVPVRGEGGRVDGALVTMQEVTEMRALLGQAAAATGGAEHLSGALQACDRALFCTNTDTKILEWTPKLEALSGYSSGQATGQDASFWVAEAFQGAFKKAIDQALRGDENARCEIALANGQREKMWLNVMPWRSATGSIVGTLGSLEDPLQADRSVVEADFIRKAAGDLLDKANAVMFSMDRDLKVVETNFRMDTAFGKESTTLRGQSLKDLVAASSLKVMEDAARNTLQEKPMPPLQATLLPDLQVVAGMSPQYSLSGEVIGVLVVAQECPEAVLSVPDAKSAAPNGIASKSKQSMVMHELRSPLHGIIGLTSTLAQEKSSMQKALMMMGNSAERVLDLVMNLMDYWNLTAEEAKTEEMMGERVDLAELAKDIITRSESYKDKRGKPLRKDAVKVVRNLSAATLKANAQMMSQIVQHLLVNALKFTQKGEVHVTVEQVSDSVVLKVSDTGIGIKSDSPNRMFDPFQQEDSSESRKYDGIGLGLTIVREVVRIHNGSCKLESSSTGTTVTVTLPCKPPPASATAGTDTAKPNGLDSSIRPDFILPPRGSRPTSWLGRSEQIGVSAATAEKINSLSEQRSTAPASSKAGGDSNKGIIQSTGSLPAVKEKEDAQKLILSVDDDFVNQEVMRSILEPAGYKTVPCMSGTECLEYLEVEKNPRPLMILLDLMMPVISGFEVLESVRNNDTHCDIPIIMVSAKNQASSVVKGFELGCADWIHKPFCRQELLARIKTQLRTRDKIMSRWTVGEHVPEAEAVNRKPDEGEPDTGATSELSRQPSSINARLGKGEADTTAMYAMLDTEASDSALAILFSNFEKLSRQHQAFRTEIIGSSYLAVTVSASHDSCHADKLLLLACDILELSRQAGIPLKIGLHTANNDPITINVEGMEEEWRVYPDSCFFSGTVREAKQLCSIAAAYRILVSHSARCRLGADVEVELQQKSLRIRKVPATGGVGECYCVVKATESDIDSDPCTIVMQPPPAQLQRPEQPEKEQNGVRERQLQEELQKARDVMANMQRDLLLSEEKAKISATESLALRQQLREQEQSQRQVSAFTTSASQEHKATTDMAQPSSLVFLQWQNAHLQAEVRQYEQALSTTKANLSRHMLTSQFLEAQQSVLQARVEHLEIDLAFKSASSGSMHMASIAPRLWQPPQLCTSSQHPMDDTGAASTAATSAVGNNFSPAPRVLSSNATGNLPRIE